MKKQILFLLILFTGLSTYGQKKQFTELNPSTPTGSGVLVMQNSDNLNAPNSKFTIAQLWAGTPLAGDISGTATGATVAQIQGRPVASTLPTTGQALVWNGSTWSPGTVSGGGGITDVFASVSPIGTNTTGVGTSISPYVSSDGTAGIQQAFASFTIGGIVGLKAGTYLITSPIQMNAHALTLDGGCGGFSLDPNGINEGFSGTKLKCTGNGIEVYGGNYTAGQRKGNICLRNLYMWGTNTFTPFAGTSTQTGIFVKGGLDQPRFEDINIGGFALGLVLSSSVEFNDLSYYSRVNILGGLKAVYANNAVVNYNKFSDCCFADQLEHNVYVTGGVGAEQVNFTNCTFVRGCGVNGGTNRCNVYLGVKYSTVSGGQCALAGVLLQQPSYTAATQTASGFILQANNCSVSGVTINANTGYGIQVRGNNCTINGCNFISNGLGDILVESGATNTLIIAAPGTIINDNGTGTIILGTTATTTGSTTVVAGNITLAKVSGHTIDAGGVDGTLVYTSGSLQNAVTNGATAEMLYVSNTNYATTDFSFTVPVVPSNGGSYFAVVGYTSLSNRIIVNIITGEVYEFIGGSPIQRRIPTGTTSANDIIRIVLTGGNLVFRRNGTIAYTCAVTATSAKLGFQFYRANGTVGNPQN